MERWLRRAMGLWDLVAKRPWFVDSVLCVALAAGTVAYIWIWPRDLYPLDEGLFLYDSRRLLEGDVFYRDLFELITPGAFYAMALVFRVFGVDFTVARMAMAAVHAAIAILVFLSCRRLGVRRSFSLTAAVAHLAMAYPAMSRANPHWFGTLLTLVVLYLLLLVPWRRPSPALALVGLANGALIMVQQQKGVIIAIGVTIVLVLDHLLARRESPLPFASLRTRLALFFAGSVGLAGLSTIYLVWRAGFRPVWEALVVFPLFNYSGQAQCSRWGFRGTAFFGPRFPFQEVVPKLPFLAGLGLLRVVAGWVRAMDGASLRRVMVPSLLTLFATLSVSYCPNYIHLGIIAPIPLVLLAETAEALFGALARLNRIFSPVGLVAAGALIALMVPEMWRTMELRRKKFPIRHQTPVGRVDFRNREETALVDTVRQRARPDEEVFAYPTYPGLYFLSGTRNATRFQILLSDYSSPAHYQEVLEVLERKKTRLIAVNTFSVRAKTDPIMWYVHNAYRRVPLGAGPRFPHFLLFERKEAELPPPAPPAQASPSP